MFDGEVMLESRIEGMKKQLLMRNVCDWLVGWSVGWWILRNTPPTSIIYRWQKHEIRNIISTAPLPEHTNRIKSPSK
jgi:hypothetical protein